MIKLLSTIVLLACLSPLKALSLTQSSPDEIFTLNTAAPFTCPAGDLGSVSYINSSNYKYPDKEPQPSNFVCEVFPTRKVVPLSKIDVFLSFTVAMSMLALEQWADYQEKFRLVFAYLDVKLASSKAPGISGLHTKEMLWAIRILFCYLQEHNYATVQFKVMYRNDPLLGFGQILSTASGLGSSSLGSNINNGTTTADVNVEKQSATTNNTGSLSQNLTGQITGPNEITITDFHSGGDAFRPYVIYSLLQTMIISEAEYNDKDASTAGVVGFNDGKDWTIGILATSLEAVENLTHRTVILALGDLAQRLPSVVPPELRWHEMVFRVRLDGAIVARGYIRRADPPTPPSVAASDTVATE